MKKLLFSLVVLASFGLLTPSHASLYSFYQGHLPSIVARQEMASFCGIANYTGTSVQNTKLENCLTKNSTTENNQLLLGASQVSPATPLFDTSLQSSIQQTDTSMNLVSGTDIAGNSLNGYVCLTIDSGTPTVEYVCGTASTTPTLIFNLQRGIYVTSTGTISISSLAQPHRRGADVRITDYPTLQIIGNFLNGTQVIPNPLIYATSTVISNTNTQQIASVGYVNGVGAGGFTCSNVSSTMGVQCNAGTPNTVGINASSTTGIGFDQNGALYQKVSSTTGLAEDSNGIKIVTTTLINLIASTTPIAGGIPLFQSNGQLTVSSSPVTSTDAISKSFVLGNIKSVSTSPMISLANNTDHFSTSTPGMLTAAGQSGTSNSVSIILEDGTSTAAYQTLYSYGVGGVSGQQTGVSGSILVPANYFFKAAITGTGAGTSIVYMPFSTY